MKKKLNFKKLLATASAFAVITGASNSAMGANAQTTQNGGINAFGTNAHWNNAPVASGDNLIIGNAGDTINIDVANFYITQVDLNGKKLGGITVNVGGTQLGNVGGNAGALTFGGAHDLTLVGGDAGGRGNASVYDGLDGVDFGAAGGGLASTLTIDTRVAIAAVNGPAGAIDLAGAAQNAANATLNVNTNLNVANESWGAIKTINIGKAANAATFKIESANAANINLNTAAANTVNFLHNDSVLHLENTGGAGNAVIQHGHIGGDGDLNGKLIIESNGNAMDVNAANGATIGKDIDNRLQQLDFTGNKASTVAAKVYAQTINYGVTGANEALTFGAEVHGGEGSLLKFTAGNATEVVFNENAQISLIDFNNNDKTVTIAAGKTLTANLVGKNADAAIKGTLKFAGAGELAGVATNLTAVIANGAGAVTIGAGDHVVTTFKAANAGSIFDFADGASIDGAIDNTSGGVNATKLNFAGSSTGTGAVGATAAFAEINLNGDENSSVTFGNDTDATDFNIGKGIGVLDSTGAARTLTAEVKFTDADSGTLLIKGANNATIAGDVAQAGGNRGAVKIAGDVVNKNVVFNNVVGVAADANALKLLEIENGFTGEVQLDADTHITDVQIGGAAKIRLAANHYKFGGITSAGGSGNGTLLVNANNANLVGRANAGDAVINLGTSESRLAKLEFAANHTLNIGDGVNIHVNEFASDGAGANRGTLFFKGTSIFESLAQNNNDKLTAITLDDKANVTILSPNTVVNGLTKLGDNSTLAIAGNFNANGGLDAANAGNGTVRFTNTNDATIDGAIGGGVSLKTIEFAGGNVEFANAVTHAAGNKFVFSGDTASTVKFNAATNVGDNVFTNNSGATHTVVIAKAGVTTFTKNLATSVDNQLNFQLANVVNAKITGGDATGTNFTTGANKTGELELAKDGTVINSAGEFNKSLDKVDFTNSATITNNTYAEEVQVVAGKTAILGGTTKSYNFHLDGIAAKTVFSDGATVDSIIKTTVAGKGLVEFAGGATISQNLGVDAANALNTVTFANDAEKTALLGANIYATNIAMRQGVVKLTSDAELHGITNATATTLDLRDKELTANNNLTFNGANKIIFSTTNAGNTLTGGQITIAAGKNVAFVAGTELAITANDKGNARPTGGGSHDFTLIDGDVFAVAGSKLELGRVTVDNTNAFTRWTAAIGENNRLILTQTDNAAGALKKILGAKADAADNANIDALANAALNTEGFEVVKLLSTLTDNAAKTEETLDRLAPLTTIADSIEGIAANVGNDLTTRTMSLAGSQGNPVQTRTVSSERVVGVSAGDDHARFGAWFSPFYNNTTQKGRKGAAGYKGESYGASFGFDTRTNEDTIIGAAFTAANSELKHKNFKSGDKTKVNSLLFSIYGMHQLTDTWFALGSATVGTNEIRNSERKVSGLNSYEIANAKYSSMSFSSEVMFGYNHITEQATITPMGGLRYTRVNDGGYKETGNTFQNLDVSTKASNKFEVILGARASGGTFDLNGMSVTPEVHAFINHDLINKNPKQSIKLGSTTLTAKSRKPVRTTYNLGLGANAEFGMMEYGASYDAQLANKRVGHQGTLRLRVNF